MWRFRGNRKTRPHKRIVAGPAEWSIDVARPLIKTNGTYFVTLFGKFQLNGLRLPDKPEHAENYLSIINHTLRYKIIPNYEIWKVFENIDTF